MFAQRGEQTCGPAEQGFTSIFKACNLQSAISLLEELDQSPKGDPTVPRPCFPGNLSKCGLLCILLHIPFSVWKPYSFSQCKLKKSYLYSPSDCSRNWETIHTFLPIVNGNVLALIFLLFICMFNCVGCQFPASLAWLMATRPVFLYPELLPSIQLRPSRFKGQFTSAEDWYYTHAPTWIIIHSLKSYSNNTALLMISVFSLVVLGHKHLISTLHPLQMTCRYLLAARSFVSLKSHIREACHKPFPNVIKVSEWTEYRKNDHDIETAYWKLWYSNPYDLEGRNM